MPSTKIQPKDTQSWPWWWLGLGVALMLAASLRLPFFSQIPAGLNRDEAALGYNAFSLLKTGTDEYGARWPISITSFGDQKLPGYVYLLIPFISLFGLEAWVIRLPSLLAGFFVIAGSGLVVRHMARTLRFTPNHATLASFLTMLILALAPLTNHFSRVAYEAHVALACFVWGFASYLFALDHKKSTAQRALLITAATLWSATLLTYHSYHLFLPLFLIGLLVIDFRRLKKLDMAGLAISMIIGAITIGLLWQGGVVQANLIKNRGISPFHSTQLWIGATAYRATLPPQLAFFGKLIFNPLTQSLTIITQNLTSIISGTFFFVHGSGHGDHNPSNMSNLPLYVLPLCVAWLIGTWHQRHSPAAQRFVLLILAAMIPAALTIQPQHEIRLAQLFLGLILGAGLGGALLWRKLQSHQWLKWVALGIFSLWLFTTTLRTALNYLFIIPKDVESHQGYHQLAQALAKYSATGMPVLTQNSTSSPYIWYLVENKIDPAWYQANTERYSPTDEGFIHVKRINTIQFIKFDWGVIRELATHEPIIIIVRPQDMSSDLAKERIANVLEEIVNHQGTTIYQVWKIDDTKLFNETNPR